MRRFIHDVTFYEGGGLIVEDCLFIQTPSKKELGQDLDFGLHPSKHYS